MEVQELKFLRLVLPILLLRLLLLLVLTLLLLYGQLHKPLMRTMFQKIKDTLHLIQQITTNLLRLLMSLTEIGAVLERIQKVQFLRLLVFRLLNLITYLRQTDLK